MPRLTTNQTAWILILAVALAARLAAGVWWQSRLGHDKFFFGDSESYWELARTIASGEPYAYHSHDARVFRTPGYPLLLAGLFRLFGGEPPIFAARALSALLGTIGVAVVGWWTSRLFDPRAGRFAGWIAAIYPGGVSMGAFVLTEAPFSPFMLAQLALWGLAARAPSNGRAAALALGGGAAGAIATLIRPSWLLFTPFALVIALVFDRQRSRQALVGLALVASFVLCMLPWWVRNYQITGHFVPTTLQVGASLYDGLNPNADGSSQMDFVPQFVAQEHAANATPEGNDVFEYRLDQRMSRAAIDWAQEHPARVAELAWIKAVRMWNFWPNEPSFRSWPLRLVVLFTYGPLMCLALVGVWRFSRGGWPYVLAWLPAVYFTLLHVVFVGSIRYREPAMLALTVLAAGVLSGAARHALPLAPPAVPPIEKSVA